MTTGTAGTHRLASLQSTPARIYSSFFPSSFRQPPLFIYFFYIHPLSPSVYPLPFPPHVIYPISSEYFAALPHFSKTCHVLNIMGTSPSICCPVCFSITSVFWRWWNDILLICTCSCSTSLFLYSPVIVSASSGCRSLSLSHLKYFLAHFCPLLSFLYNLLDSLYNPYGIGLYKY